MNWLDDGTMIYRGCGLVGQEQIFLCTIGNFYTTCVCHGEKCNSPEKSEALFKMTTTTTTTTKRTTQSSPAIIITSSKKTTKQVYKFYQWHISKKKCCLKAVVTKADPKDVISRVKVTKTTSKPTISTPRKLEKESLPGTAVTKISGFQTLLIFSLVFLTS